MAAERKVTTLDLRRRKGKEKLAVVTAYDATMAALLDAAGMDVLMVGDSLGMVVQGDDTTLGVTLAHMVYHCRAVTSCQPRAHVVCDLPFMSYQVSVEQALTSAGVLLKEGRAEAVKLEGGAPVAPTVRRLVDAGIPVMGHIGLTPQSVHQMGGFRVQGRTTDSAFELLEDAQALEDAGAYALVLEGIPADAARSITRTVSIPTIGIGAGPDTDGQVLVCYDLLGMYRGLAPKFVRHFAELGDAVVGAAQAYAKEVRAGTFPGPEHTFAMERGHTAPQAPGPVSPGQASPGPVSPSEADAAES
jgi:3-methyl-2-oxobutanoate hydroxymethyltransferase